MGGGVGFRSQYYVDHKNFVNTPPPPCRTCLKSPGGAKNPIFLCLWKRYVCLGYHEGMVCIAAKTVVCVQDMRQCDVTSNYNVWQKDNLWQRWMSGHAHLSPMRPAIRYNFPR